MSKKRVRKALIAVLVLLLLSISTFNASAATALDYGEITTESENSVVTLSMAKPAMTYNLGSVSCSGSYYGGWRKFYDKANGLAMTQVKYRIGFKPTGSSPKSTDFSISCYQYPSVYRGGVSGYNWNPDKNGYSWYETPWMSVSAYSDLRLYYWVHEAGMSTAKPATFKVECTVVYG